MKVLMITESFGSGVYEYIKDLSNNLIKQEYQIYILFSKRKETPLYFEKDFDKSIFLIETTKFNKKINLKNLFESRQIIKKTIKDIKPDIVHAHSSFAGFSLRTIKIKKSIKAFYTPHGFAFSNANNSKMKNFIFMLLEFVGYLNKKVVTVACSFSEYNHAKLFSKNVLLINNALDLEHIPKFDVISPKSIKKIVTIGRISDQKNPQLFNSIAALHLDIEFVWIGDGELKHILTSPNISVTGWLNHNDVLKKLITSDMFLLTSKYEGLSIALLEAMYLKRLVVVTNVTGNKEIINDKNGYLINNIFDFEEIFYSAIDYNKTNIAHLDVKTYYSYEQFILKYLKAYNGEFDEKDIV